MPFTFISPSGKTAPQDGPVPGRACGSHAKEKVSPEGHFCFSAVEWVYDFSPSTLPGSCYAADRKRTRLCARRLPTALASCQRRELLSGQACPGGRRKSLSYRRTAPTCCNLAPCTSCSGYFPYYKPSSGTVTQRVGAAVATLPAGNYQLL